MKKRISPLLILAVIILATLPISVIGEPNHTHNAERVNINPSDGFDTAFWDGFTAVVLTITLMVLIFYTIATYRLLNQQKEANSFAAVTRMHERLTNETSYKLRRYLHSKFEQHFDEAFDAFSSTHPQTLLAFNQLLDSKISGVNHYTALDAVEMVLMDFDMIALTYWLDIKAAKDLARAYRTVLKYTAPAIMPFVGMQQKLRLEKTPPEEYYKSFYLCLLRELKILKDQSVQRSINRFRIDIPESPWEESR